MISNVFWIGYVSKNCVLDPYHSVEEIISTISRDGLAAGKMDKSRSVERFVPKNRSLGRSQGLHLKHDGSQQRLDPLCVSWEPSPAKHSAKVGHQSSSVPVKRTPLFSENSYGRCYRKSMSDFIDSLTILNEKFVGELKPPTRDCVGQNLLHAERTLPAKRCIYVGLDLRRHTCYLNSIKIIFACLLAVAVARPDSGYSSRSSAEVPILRDDRVYPSAAGEYSTDTETGDGISISESGYGSGPDGAVESQGSVRFTHPDGESFELTYVANAEGGYQPESDALPIAPEFPHPIPQFVLDQIAKAAEEDRNRRDSDEDRYSYQ
ncbi:Insect cuticle protein [Trinorchestia longiramus]|nr:Insect cuticle protein [Trinorchestia longiramus]